MRYQSLAATISLLLISSAVVAQGVPAKLTIERTLSEIETIVTNPELNKYLNPSGERGLFCLSELFSDLAFQSNTCPAFRKKMITNFQDWRVAALHDVLSDQSIIFI